MVTDSLIKFFSETYGFILRHLSEKEKVKHEKEAEIRQKIGPALVELKAKIEDLHEDTEGCEIEITRKDISTKIIDERKERIKSNLSGYIIWYDKYREEIEFFLDHKDKDLKEQLKEMYGYARKVLCLGLDLVGCLTRLNELLRISEKRVAELCREFYFD